GVLRRPVARALRDDRRLLLGPGGGLGIEASAQRALGTASGLAALWLVPGRDGGRPPSLEPPDGEGTPSPPRMAGHRLADRDRGARASSGRRAGRAAPGGGPPRGTRHVRLRPSLAAAAQWLQQLDPRAATRAHPRLPRP